MLLEKIFVVSHTLEMYSPCEQIVSESVVDDAHKDAECDPSGHLYSTVHSRNSSTQTHVQVDSQTLQQSHSDHVQANAPDDSTQWTDSPITQNFPPPTGDLSVNDTQITQETTDNSSPPLASQDSRGYTGGKQFATCLPN